MIFSCFFTLKIKKSNNGKFIIYLTYSVSFVHVFFSIPVRFTISQSPHYWLFWTYGASHVRVSDNNSRTSCFVLPWRMKRSWGISLNSLGLGWCYLRFESKEFLKLHVDLYLFVLSHLSLRDKWAMSLLLLLTNGNVLFFPLLLLLRWGWNYRLFFLLGFIDFLSQGIFW